MTMDEEYKTDRHQYQCDGSCPECAKPEEVRKMERLHMLFGRLQKKMTNHKCVEEYLMEVKAESDDKPEELKVYQEQKKNASEIMRDMITAVGELYDIYGF
jgi:hypothetical protein